MKGKPIYNRKKGPEAKIQDDIIKFLRERGWFVKILHGNMYSHGLPDLYIARRRYGSRWVEIKNPESFKFTPAQWEDFPRMLAEGVGIWVMIAATEEEYQKLFDKPNLWVYMAGFHK